MNSKLKKILSWPCAISNDGIAGELKGTCGDIIKTRCRQKVLLRSNLRCLEYSRSMEYTLVMKVTKSGVVISGPQSPMK